MVRRPRENSRHVFGRRLRSEEPPARVR
jgi:hypothetical protein